MKDTHEIPTQPYKWIRGLYARAAEQTGAKHHFENRQTPDPEYPNRKKGAYLQILEGDDKKIARTERIVEQVLMDIETKVRAKFPGGKMFTAPAAKMRQELAEAVDISKAAKEIK